ncbi:hypothetical protein IMSAGC002_01910 [Lachnospiraceae bacterium]|nr:hypothetical protein IMSAGC002_01910 [Lachnospiraceae bacterium]
MENYLIRGILIGLLFGIPVGAVGALAVQRTFTQGFKAGLLTGFGSSVADCLYAYIGAFGLTLVSDLLLEYQTIINIIGSIFILFMGVRLLIHKKEAGAPYIQSAGGIKMFLSSFVIGITNPAAILTFLFAFSFFGITGQIEWFDSTGLVVGVLIGTYIWWGLLAAIVSCIKKKTNGCSLPYMNRIFGTILSLFGITILVRTFL